MSVIRNYGIRYDTGFAVGGPTTYAWSGSHVAHGELQIVGSDREYPLAAGWMGGSRGHSGGRLHQ
jgi:hypothetical protein